MKCTSPRPSPTVRVIRTRKTGEEGRESEMVWETARCVREVHVHGIRREEDEPVFDRETVHWLRCLQFVRRGGNGVRGDRCGGDGGGGCDEEDGSYRVQCRITDTPVYNGADVLESIAPSLHSKVISSITNSIPNNHDHNDSANGKNSRHVDKIESSSNTCRPEDAILRAYFRRDCTCNTTKSTDTYRNALLYCHCLATEEPLDPGFRFRDAVLDLLLEMERRVVQSVAQGKETGSRATRKRRKAGVDDGGPNVATASTARYAPTSNKGEASSTARSATAHSHGRRPANADPTASSATPDPPFGLQFSYRSIVDAPTLLTIAHHTTYPTNVRRLYTNTFQGLRNDGVLHLLDVDSDQYVLLSLHRVLLPEMRDLVGREEGWRVAVDSVGLRLRCAGGEEGGGFRLGRWCRCCWRVFRSLGLRL